MNLKNEFLLIYEIRGSILYKKKEIITFKSFNKIYEFVDIFLGVAVGAGWQSLVAYINLGCYYIVGLPAGILLGFTFGFGAEVIYYSLCV
jgi:Na+-driven multidrug efflux pump